jgi:DNA replication protein DnaC
VILNEPKPLTKAHMIVAGVPEKYWEANLADYPDTYTGFSACRSFHNEVVDMLKDGIGLILHGPPGHGKTRMAVALLKQSMRHCASACFLEANQIQRSIINKDYELGIQSSRPVMELAEEVDLLVLDDLGAEHSKEWLKAQVEALLRFRIARKRSSIVTTNLGMKDLETIYGSGLSSVLKEALYPAKITGKDWRGDQAKSIAERFKK